MSRGGRYPFWLKNQSDNASMEANMARHEASKEREEKEEYQRQLANVDAVLSDLKLLFIREHAKGTITMELLELIVETIDQVKTK